MENCNFNRFERLGRFGNRNPGRSLDESLDKSLNEISLDTVMEKFDKWNMKEVTDKRYMLIFPSTEWFNKYLSEAGVLSKDGSVYADVCQKIEKKLGKNLMFYIDEMQGGTEVEQSYFFTGKDMYVTKKEIRDKVE